MCRKPWHPQVNKQLMKEAMRNIVDTKWYVWGNKAVAYATIIHLWTQIKQCCGNKNIEEANIIILSMPKYIL